MLVQQIEYTNLSGDFTAYGRQEVEAALAEAQTIKAEYDALMAQAWQLAVVPAPRGTIWGPDPTPMQPLYVGLMSIDEPCIVSRMRSIEPYPVKTWQREIAKARRQMAKVRKLMAELN